MFDEERRFPPKMMADERLLAPPAEGLTAYPTVRDDFHTPGDYFTAGTEISALCFFRKFLAADRAEGDIRFEIGFFCVMHGTDFFQVMARDESIVTNNTCSVNKKALEVRWREQLAYDMRSDTQYLKNSTQHRTGRDEPRGSDQVADA